MLGDEIQWPCELPEPIKALLLKSAKVHFLEADDYLQMGKCAENGIFHVMQGMVVVASTNLSKSCPFIVMKKGDWFGGLGIFKESSLLYKIVSINPSKLLFIPNKIIRDAATLSPDIYKFLYLMSVDHAREAIETLFASSGMQLTQKVAYLLLEVSKSFPHVAGTKPMILMSQTMLAQALGMSRITLNQQLHLLEQKGIISTERKKVYILDIPALKELTNPATVS